MEPRQLMANFSGIFVLCVLFGVWCVAPAVAQGSMQDLVDAALNEPVTERIDIPTQPVMTALAALEDKTGLRFAIAEDALANLPAGDQTQISIVIADVTVREALQRVFNGLGLEMRVADGQIYVEPAPVMERLGRRLTLPEVEVLQRLAAGRYSGEDYIVNFRVPETAPVRVHGKEAENAPGANAFQQLETYTRQYDARWVPAGGSIVIYGADEEIARRLEQPLDMTYRQIPLDQLLTDLARRVNVTFFFEPGSLQAISAAERQVTLVQHDLTVRQALELLAGNTGLAYEVRADGVHIRHTNGISASGSPRPAIVAMLHVPIGDDGTTIDFLIRENELPPEFAALKARKLPELIERLRAELQE